MTNSANPNLELGEPPKRLASLSGRTPRSWLWTLLILQLLMCGVLAAILLRPGRLHIPIRGNTGVTAAELKKTAIELEERSLDSQAAKAWGGYLQATSDDVDRASILYRIGKLYFQAEQYGKAASALVQAEQVEGDDEELKAKTGPILVDCLRRLGHYGEVGRELSRRVEVGAEKTGKGRVLATFAGESFTEADLDRMIERSVDEMLALQQGGDEAAARDQLLKRFAGPRMREQLLHEMLRRELFSRRARDLKLDREPKFQQARKFLEDNLLASQFLARELKPFQPTGVDIEAYYHANKQRYEQPEELSVWIHEMAEDADVASLLQSIKSLADFKKRLAAKPGTSSKTESTEPQQVIRGRFHPQLGNTESLFQLSAGEWTTEPHVNGDNRYLVFIEKKSPVRITPLEQARAQVEGDYRSRKRQELTEKLYRDLMSRYEVHINRIEQSGDDSNPHTPAADKQTSSKQTNPRTRSSK